MSNPLGTNSDYPLSYDKFFHFYDEYKAGYPITKEAKVIPEDPYTITLDHPAKTGTLSILGYAEVTSPSPSQNEFYVSDYYTPGVYESKTGIDYEIGQTLVFNSANLGATLSIDYITPGDKLTAENWNKMVDILYKIQRTLGRVGSRRDLGIGDYSTVAGFISYLSNLLMNHAHDGQTTLQLNSSSFSNAAWKDGNIDADANIAQSKLQDGIRGYGVGSISSGETQVDIQTGNYEDNSNKFILLTRIHDSGYNPDGFLSLTTHSNYFRVYWEGPALTGTVEFNWLLI